MKISYSWLKEYVENLPPVEEVVSTLTMHSFEVEGVEKEDDDSVLDIKILPNRSHDCLSHYGVASEIASVCNIQRKELLPHALISKTAKIKLSLDTKTCKRGMMMYISGIKVVESPDWMKEKLKMIGQRPINSIVDITNYLMYAFGQPMHAFDAKKLKADVEGNYAISIRQAKAGEKIKLLNGLDYELDPNVMVIADSEKALDVAGVMGGLDTGVSFDTTDIILSLSSFDAVAIRKTASKLKIRTDASQRFENDISPSLADRVLPYALKLISEISGGEVLGGVDIYPIPQIQTVISTSAQKISTVLGTVAEPRRIIELLAKQNIIAEEKNGNIVVTVPLERLDLTLPEDIAEEVGRIYGYEKIAPSPLTIRTEPVVNPLQYTMGMIRHTLCMEGFSEIQTYSFVSKGEVEIANPLAKDKSFLRKNLISGMEYSVEYNFKFLDLLGLKEIKLFEIGKIFTTDAEILSLSIGVKFPKSVKKNVDEEIARSIARIEKELGVSFGDISIVGGMAEINLDKIIPEVKVPSKYPQQLFEMIHSNVSFKSISAYPFAVRDVAVFVPQSVSEEVVRNLISARLTPIVVRFSLFDTFTKSDPNSPNGQGKTSYAYRLVFQSMEKTLTDEEINEVMNKIYETLKSEEGFEIR